MGVELVQIGEAARILDVSKQTLRRWEKAGVLVPESRLPSLGCKGGRRYSRKQVEEFKKRLREEK